MTSQNILGEMVVIKTAKENKRKKNAKSDKYRSQ